MINPVRLDGFRTLSSSSGNVERLVIQPKHSHRRGLHRQSGIAGTIDSEYLTSSRPIRALSVSGDYSGVTITFKDANGAVIGSQGNRRPRRIPLASTRISCHHFPIPDWQHQSTQHLCLNSQNRHDLPTVDLGSDGTNDWAFPMGSSYGNLGWQSLIAGGTMQRSESVSITPSNPGTISVLVPSGTSADANVDATSWAAAGSWQYLLWAHQPSTRRSWCPWVRHLSPRIVPEQALQRPTSTAP